MSVRVLSARDVQQVTDGLRAPVLIDMMAKTLAAISDASMQTPDGITSIQNPLRISTETPRHKTLYMPSRLTTAETSETAIKVVAVPKPDCPVPGLPATNLLMDEESGAVRAIVNSGALTGIRTAAASALATKLLADPDSTSLLVFGTGVQAFHHARLILELFPKIERLGIVARAPTSRARAMASNLPDLFPSVRTALVDEAELDAALRDADIICTCVPSTSPLFEVEQLKPSVHINAIGSYTPSMFEFPPALIAETQNVPSTRAPIPQVLVDSRTACLAESGELIAAKIAASRTTELGELFEAKTGIVNVDPDTREKVKALRAGGRSLFKCVGIGGMDVAITRLVVEEAEKRSFGAVVPF
ncbi:hypothetical protein JCM8202_003821 [Rhodotorula sphaerocarpa]